MKLVYLFNEGNKDMKNILGGKGANLCEMTKLGLPVPTGIIVSTEACRMYHQKDSGLNTKLQLELETSLKKLEEISNKKFGSKTNPLLVSVRSGSVTSMPGMMDTILNLGMNDEIVASLADSVDDPRYIYDCYRRFIWMYSNVVKGIDDSLFEDVLTKYKEYESVTNDSKLSISALKEVIEEYKGIYLENMNEAFPSDVYYQLYSSIVAVFKSWNNARAITYRKLNNIDDNLFTAVNIQQMVYGNLSDNSLTGVSFTRNPSTGENVLFGEYLVKAQGEDIVAGIRTPNNIEELKTQFPLIYEQLYHYSKLLENNYKDMQDMEWTVEDSKLFILQTRSGKREAKAALKIALDLLDNDVINEEELINRLTIKDINNLLHPSFDKVELDSKTPITKGLNAGAGAAVGKIYFSANAVVAAHNNNESDIILVREETSPEDIEGMNYARGILTVRGGMTSHAAVVARGMGKCCICGASEVSINQYKKMMFINGQTYSEGDYISLNGDTGYVYEGGLTLVDSEVDENIVRLIAILNKYNNLKVMANADTPTDAITALKYGAEGIGLCRTEHMFFDKDRIFEVRKMILADTYEDRQAALDKLLPYQLNDFYEMFKVMNNKHVTIRYIDPPLHEFLPHTDEQISALASSLNITIGKLRRRKNALKEFNPMMGHRGCRLSITYPEIIIMQTTAIIEACIKASYEGVNVEPELMIPLTVDIKEYEYVKDIILDTINKIFTKHGVIVKYKIGTMIETPRACLIASKLAKVSDFFSFGTNDLTQLTYGFSRDDSSKFLNKYYEEKILKTDPFMSIDKDGVAKLVAIATIDAKNNNDNIQLGICGEHAGDEDSINLCYELGLSYVSCSAYRVLMAKLVAAKNQINN